MTESATSLVIENFLEILKTLHWCKQGEDNLIAVEKCKPEIIVALSDREARVFPGGTPIKINKSWLKTLQEYNEDGNPIPIMLVWKKEVIEIWYRRQKSHDFPYDVWQNPVAEAYERECVRIPANLGGAKFTSYHHELLTNSKACPPVIRLF